MTTYIRDVLKSELDEETGTIKHQLGDLESLTPESDEADYFGPPNYYAIPSNPSIDSAQAMYMEGEGGDVCIGYQDWRHADLYGQLKPGETCITAPGEKGDDQARIMLKQKGIISLLTRKDYKSASKAMTIAMDPSSDTIWITNAAGNGIIIEGEKQLAIKFGQFSLVSDGVGVSLMSGGQTVIDGRTIALGYKAIVGAGSLLLGLTGIDGKASTKVIAE